MIYPAKTTSSRGKRPQAQNSDTSKSRSLLPKALLLCAGLALAGCTDPDRFDYLDGANGAGGAGAGGAVVPGSSNDPASPLYFQQTVGDRVLFLVDQSTLSPQAEQVLAGQVQWLNRNTDYDAVIEGHADEQGTREYNLALGARRANSVREYLVSQGVAPGRIRTISYGKERPLAICSEEACYSQNRRAVTVLAAGGAGV
ncbi:peptidoglycan-associated lipoprotein Pal [Pseudooceanicola algae]|uniref:Peptidoglycan-associated protein n=1 Tax=Pseudooceanicola algae TaxID=1537215 RepID=A0A418SI41_9RHOB|nr:peptidoglycan-associated lipoprotein Pal [Pseudooceanicola algae]QPM88933.1 Peptidoglycan-associated lipoprotein [Pseudooceanicola algae]